LHIESYSNMKKILAIVGARPQFIKHAPVEKALSGEFLIPSIHTGQHYDENMSRVFFEQLNMNPPTYMLQTGGGNHGVQTGKMMVEIEPILEAEKPDAVLIYGDANSALAGSLVASKLKIPVIHIESGLRSFNKNMPEEINRIVADHLSAVLFAPSDEAVNNLKNEGITKNVFKAGDVMCDMLKLAGQFIAPKTSDAYYYATIHRPYNTDNINRLSDILNHLNQLDKEVVFAIHPRTSSIIEKNKIDISSFTNIRFIPPVSYFDNISYLQYCSALITDSGGMQKEAYILKKKCITIRSETEWTETLQNGWNHLLFDDLSPLNTLVHSTPGEHNENLYGNGKAAYEILNVLKAIL
jgi:UDP-GlcNAc3NAcA epimerase